MGYLTTGGAAKLCGVHINTIKRWVQSGELECLQTPGGHWRIPRVAFEQFVELMRSREEANAPATKILIIDDDPDTVEFSSTVIEHAPFRAVVKSASNGYQGLIKLGKFQPDILVLDIMMPGINGLELLHRLREQPELCGDMRIMVFTGARDRRLVMRKVEEAKPDAVLLKPATVDQFTQKISTLVHASDHRQAGSGR